MGATVQSISAMTDALAEQPVAAKPDRRERERFLVRVPVRYRLPRPRKADVVDVGETLDISSSGLAFSTSQSLTPGQLVNVAVEWPARLDGRCPLQLVVRGRVVRATATTAAIRIYGYQFKLRPSVMTRKSSVGPAVGQAGF